MMKLNRMADEMEISISYQRIMKMGEAIGYAKAKAKG